ncbi:MAG: hypothetical protein D6711_10710 [Chloroflexi bacterium]|nr:MAG: hypothetical protein D6711_10710 [Chloroflexota bacterium]
MNLRRHSAYLKTRKASKWGGSWADSAAYSSLFNSTEQPTDLGLIDIEVFATKGLGDIVNKPMTYMASKQMIPLRAGGGGKVTWKLATDGVSNCTIVDVDPNLSATPGKAGTRFRIALDRGYYNEPSLLKTESTDAPMLIIEGFPEEESPNKFWYTVSLQTSDPNAFIDPKYLQPGRTVRDASSMVPDEMNTKFAGLEFGTTSELGSQITYAARGITVSDKMIRREIEAARRGSNETVIYDTQIGAIENGVSQLVVAGPKKADGTVDVKRGKLMSFFEYALRERLYTDLEMNYKFGHVYSGADNDTGYIKQSGAGWFQIARESNYYEHNGYDLTLDDFVGTLESLRFNVVNPKEDVIEVHTGLVGMRMISKLIEKEAGNLNFVIDSSYFIDKVSSNATNYGLAFGSQFVELRSMGQVIRFVWDPSKDDANLFPELDEEGKPLESSSFDIFNLVAPKATMRDSSINRNVAIAYEPDAEVWVTESNVYDFTTGAIKNGGKVSSLSKEATIFMEKNGGLLIFDASQCMRIARVS